LEVRVVGKNIFILWSHMTQNLAIKSDPAPQSGLADKFEIFNLYWLDGTTGKQYRAGVAFYLEKYGEYHLKIDVLPGIHPIYARPTNTVESKINYRVEAVIKRKDGSFSRRVEVGTGFSGSDTDGVVVMDLGPFSRKLLLDLKRHE
jgi:hypothetical protein